ncbi:uncharacterized protein M421DRAFT_424183 [Didymella exigua CBS 183.55]|uniref:Uncharacterized protein n=1 Tax=Didymella exigua CBS 183.55 TaxID=1150837 RepID=A0A6A5RCY9_9PLEO|nr:uncharacterized protein M421DRAFT_424183 [Didymella exigua CBS 183.55]KAF1925160.1 hypothetical protein M421DRAFT_424183 [Didymella exigua CBS 183.55]
MEPRQERAGRQTTTVASEAPAVPKPSLPQIYRLRPRENGGSTAPTACTKLPCSPGPSSTTPSVPNISDLTHLTYEEYKAFDLSSTQHHDLIGNIRAEVPVMDVHEIDNWLLNSLAKQLEICIFPTAKLMHINPVAVKRMLDTEFRKAYGQDVEDSISGQKQQRRKRHDSAELSDN